MLDYGWGQPSSIMLSSGSGEETTTGHHQVDPEPPRAAVFDPYHNFSSSNFINTSSETHFSNSGHHLPFLHHNNPNHFTTLYGGGASSSSSYPHPQPMLTLEPGFMMVPKSEPMAAEFNSRIGLNLGGRTYFASSEDDFVNRLYRRTRMLDPAAVRCQAEGCNSDLSHAKHYHRRHKVCEFHSKAATVIAAGLTQRFCQQCSRFHLLSEFDNGKRSCRKRLADHNRRRRKTQQTTTTNNNNNQDTSNNNNTAGGGPTSSYQNIPNSGSSVTVAISPPTISLDCYGGHASSSTASTNSLFYANG